MGEKGKEKNDVEDWNYYNNNWTTTTTERLLELIAESESAA